MSWTHAVCIDCWNIRKPGQEPVRIHNDDTQVCCDCGKDTTDGVYIREDPKKVMFGNGI